MSAPKALIMMADYGHDPTETAVPYTRMKQAGFDVQFATETGKQPECDRRMLKGLTQKLLGASTAVVNMYDTMSQSAEAQKPISWSASDFSLATFDLVLFPGGHDKAIRQIIDSAVVHRLVLDYFPLTRKPGRKAVAAVCHGVMVLSESRDEQDNSVIRDCITTSLSAGFERLVFWGTRVFLGDYYKTYGISRCHVLWADIRIKVKKSLAKPEQFKSSLSLAPFVVEDEKYNYVSARFPGDVEKFSEAIVKMMQHLIS